MSNENKITKLGDKYESHGFKLISRAAVRLLDGFFHFKKRKGELVAGSATLFLIMSFCPVILLMISMTGSIMGDEAQAKEYVLGFLNSNFPQLAGWILKSISNIVDSQLNGAGGFNVVNTLVLVYACLGVVGSLIFGINQVSKVETKGGFLIEDFKSIVTGLCVAVFIMSLLAISHKGMVYNWLSGSNEYWNSMAKWIVNYQVLPIVGSLSFFTMFYQLATPRKVQWRDSFLGALSFVGCFVAGKSFYWIYLLYTKDTLTQSYGNFYSIFIAVFWVYFLMCSFFFGASVAYVSYQEIYREKLKPVTNHPAEVPTIPSSDQSSDQNSEEKKSA